MKDSQARHLPPGKEDVRRCTGHIPNHILILCLLVASRFASTMKTFDPCDDLLEPSEDVPMLTMSPLPLHVILSPYTRNISISMSVFSPQARQLCALALEWKTS